jgi:uncharacterized membrane protein YoaT (DUF817 family)
MREFISELWIFTLKQIKACAFAGSFLLLLVFSKPLAELISIPRYDLLFIAAFLIQAILVATKLETKNELKVISIFHVIGLILELFKTQPEIGSWSYPEEAFFKVSTVPLYSGFMYAAVASYIIQSWRIFNLRMENYPSYYLSVPLCILVYLNFFTHHYLPDFRWILLAGILSIFARSKIYFQVTNKERQMPTLFAFFLIAFFIWIAENIGTFFGAWQYSYQELAWQLVDFGKISSWFLLFVISFIIVADLKIYQKKQS